MVVSNTGFQSPWLSKGEQRERGERAKEQENAKKNVQEDMKCEAVERGSSHASS
jgi:hypothetical protein